MLDGGGGSAVPGGGQAAGAQTAAFFGLALDSGARRAELTGLTWEHVDLKAGRVTIAQQLDYPLDAKGPEPVFGPTKTGVVRSVTLGAETVALLREHKRQQAELKLKNRTTYADYGLVFAKAERDLQTPTATLGQPLSTNRLTREFHRLTEEADAKPIKFHGLRHTCATLLLQAGESIRTVADRLGHKDVAMTLNTYCHVMPGQQQAAAERLGAILHGCAGPDRPSREVCLTGDRQN